jgi:hypothetical protein
MWGVELLALGEVDREVGGCLLSQPGEGNKQNNMCLIWVAFYCEYENLHQGQHSFDTIPMNKVGANKIVVHRINETNVRECKEAYINQNVNISIKIRRRLGR